MPRRLPGADTVLVFACALLLFATTVTAFEARVTDVSALRVLNGDVPYRDFWTMYAPGSYTALALAYGLFGRQLLVSNVLGVITSALGVALYYRLARVACPARTAAVLAFLVAAAFFGSGYYDSFTSYPPAFLLILAGVYVTSRRITAAGAAWTLGPGVLLGIAGVFKHDVAGYAVIATSIALVIVRIRERIAPAWTPAIVLCATCAAIVGSATAVLFALGAGPDLWNDLVRFPLTDFRWVRGQYFPVWPEFQPSLLDTARSVAQWATFNMPLVALLVGAIAVWRRALCPAALFITLFAAVVFLFHWQAAHIQMNTNAISLSAWGALVAGVGLQGRTSRGWRPVGIAATAIVILWAMAFVGEQGYRLARREVRGMEWVGTAHLLGIRAPHGDAVWMRELERAIADADEPGAPLLFLSNRNDVDLFAETVPFWLTDRRPATRHHELHPGITDTEPVQLQMLAGITAGQPPVVVREHRFPTDVLDAVKAGMRAHVPVGSMLIDGWIDEHYDSGPLYGMYEVMRRRSPAEKPN